MAARLVTISKFVGSISLGLLTGLSYNSLTHITPTLLALPSAPSASRFLRSLVPRTERTLARLSLLSTLSALTAYVFSPSRGKHPFLLYAAVASTLPYAKESYSAFFHSTPYDALTELDARGRRGGKVTPPSSASSDEEWEVEASGMRTATSKGKDGGAVGGAGGEDDGNVNGEAVRAAVKKWSNQLTVKTVSYAAGFAVMVVGLWGDAVESTRTLA